MGRGDVMCKTIVVVGLICGLLGTIFLAVSYQSVVTGVRIGVKEQNGPVGILLGDAPPEVAKDTVSIIGLKAHYPHLTMAGWSLLGAAFIIQLIRALKTPGARIGATE